jgi:hypothetical protein
MTEGVASFWSTSTEVAGSVQDERTLLHLRVWGADKTGQPLQVDFATPRWGAVFLLPHTVRQVIEGGPPCGWRPHMLGAPLRVEATALERTL